MHCWIALVRPLQSGGFFTGRDITSADKVCVIGKTLVARLFQTTSPLDRTIRINGKPRTRSLAKCQRHVERTFHQRSAIGEQ